MGPVPFVTAVGCTESEVGGVVEVAEGRKEGERDAALDRLGSHGEEGDEEEIL
jgi:hypothetical protein